MNGPFAAKWASILKRAQAYNISPALLKICAILAVTLILIALWRWWPVQEADTFAVTTAEGLAQDNTNDTDSPSIDTSATAFDDTGVDDATVSGTVVVHVSGAVVTPGVYELPSASRVGDAVRLAGGLSETASEKAVNLARRIEDGEQIYIPTADEVAEAGVVQGGSNEGSSYEATDGDSSGESTTSHKVNINTADATQLDTLPGVGPAISQRIIDYRTTHGKFESIEDLKQVSGIGEKKYAQLADAICV